MRKHNLLRYKWIKPVIAADCSSSFTLLDLFACFSRQFRNGTKGNYNVKAKRSKTISGLLYTVCNIGWARSVDLCQKVIARCQLLLSWVKKQASQFLLWICGYVWGLAQGGFNFYQCDNHNILSTLTVTSFYCSNESVIINHSHAFATISIDLSFLPYSFVHCPHTSIGPAFHIDAVFIRNKTVWPCLLSSVIQLADFARYEVVVALALEFVFT